MALLSKRAEKLCARPDIGRLAARPPSDLTFIEQAISAGAPLLLDTGIYVHQLQGKTPAPLDALVQLRQVNHSVVAIQEMLHAIGVLDPADPRTKANIAAIRAVLDAIPSHRVMLPDREVMLDAAVYAGVLCRLRSYARDQRRKALHDCILFLQARKHGFILVTANVADFDLLQQFHPDSKVLFYRAA